MNNRNNPSVPADDPVSAAILKGLGGPANLLAVDCCATRLRATVADPERVVDTAFRATGAKGVIKKGGAIQVIYGAQAAVLAGNLREYLGKL